MLLLSTARIAGSALCSWGTGGDWANGCENVALPGFDLCPGHERISQALERAAAAQLQPIAGRCKAHGLHGQYDPESGYFAHNDDTYCWNFEFVRTYGETR